MNQTNRFVSLSRYADGGTIDESLFAMHDGQVPEVGDGQVLLKTLVLSVDPYMRGCMTGVDTFYLPQFVINSPIHSLGIARVVESHHPDFHPGDLVHGLMDWSDFSTWSGGGHLVGGGILRRVDPAIGKLSRALGVFGLTGLTAYFGVVNVANPEPGETILISGAAGGVGSVAGQIARLLGARVIGMAGSAKKREILVSQLGFEAAFDYRSQSLAEDLRALMPHGPDIYFDNVGGLVSQVVMKLMRRRARVIECGQIATYDDAGGGWTVDIRPIHANGLRWESFTPAHFGEFLPAANAQLLHWVGEGRLIALETEHRGLEAAPRAMIGVMRGANIGKMVVTVTEDT
jgi:NADPH-dependent curcumin reductase CurA